MSVNRIDATLTDDQRNRANAAALLADQYAKLHQVATGALEDSLDDLGRRFARKSHKAAPPA